MKLVLKIILIIGACYLLQFILPWWSIAVGAFFINLIFASKTAGNAFFSGFIAIFLLWFVKGFMVDQQAGSILSQKIVSLFMLPNPLTLIATSALIGALVGGFSGLTGYQFLKLFTRKKRGGYYS